MGTHYSYTCGSCGKHCNKKRVVRCNFCKTPICYSCRREGVCPTHYNQLTFQERSKLKSISGFFFVVLRAIYFGFFIAIAFTLSSFFGSGFGIWGGLIGSVITIGIIFTCCKAASWEEEKMDKVRFAIQQRLTQTNPPQPKLSIKVESIFREKQPKNEINEKTEKKESHPVNTGEPDNSYFTFLSTMKTEESKNPTIPEMTPITNQDSPTDQDLLTEICPECGSKYPKGVRWCGHCGDFF